MSDTFFDRTYEMECTFTTVPNTNSDIFHTEMVSSDANIYPTPAAGYKYSELLTTEDVTETVAYKASYLRNDCLMDVRSFDLTNNVVFTQDFQELWLESNFSKNEPAILSVKAPCLSTIRKKCIEDDIASRFAQVRSESQQKAKGGSAYVDTLRKRANSAKRKATLSFDAYENEMAEYKKQLQSGEEDQEKGKDFDPLTILGEHQIRCRVVSPEARKVMRAWVDCCVYLHKEGFGLDKIDANCLVVRRDSNIPCLLKNNLTILPTEGRQRSQRMKESFRNLRDFFKIHLFKLENNEASQPNGPPSDLAHFLNLLDIPNSFTSAQIADRSTLLQEHVVLKTGFETVVYLKTILDRSRMPRHASRWEKVASSLSHVLGEGEVNWIDKLKEKPHSMWNFSTQMKSTYNGLDMKDLLKCLRNLITDVCDTFQMSYESVYLIVLEAFPKLVHTLQYEIHKDETLRVSLRS